MVDRGMAQDGGVAAAGREGAERRDRRSTPWSYVLDPQALEREVGDGGSPPDVGAAATSREDEQRHDYLRRYLDAGDDLLRREIVADEAMIDRLRALRDEVPNGADVIEVVERAARLSRHAHAPLRVPPTVILGPPGVGKTRLARRLAEVLGTSLTVIDGASTSDPGPITGNAPSYRGSGPGKVIKALLEGDTISPIILFDEIEKSFGYHEGVKPLSALLPLLEPTTARSFTDDYIGLRANASGVIWICTANDTAGLPSPLLDRVIVIAMPPLGRAEFRRAVQRMLSELLAEAGLPAAQLDGSALTALTGVGLREARRVLQLSIGPALDAGRPAPSASDIAGAARLVRGSTRRPRPKPPIVRPPVGFMRFGA